MLKLGLLRTAIYAETQAEGESQEGSMEVESSARAKRQWGKQEMEPGECKRGSKNKHMPERICLGKGGLEGVLPLGRKEYCCRGGKSTAAGEERVLPPGRKEPCHLGEKEREPPYKRERAREYGTQGEAFARECMCRKAGGQRRDRSKRVHGVKTVEKNKYLTLWEGEM